MSMTAEQWEQARKLDLCMWLSSPVYARMPLERKTLYYTETVNYGRTLARRYPAGGTDILRDIMALGVRDVVPFTQQERSVLTDRAYYAPQTRVIHWNDRFSSELLCAVGGQDEKPFTCEEIDAAILLHELFHHIEETAEQPTDQMLCLKYERFFAPVFRELAAFAYVNELWGKGPCQEIDALWIKMCRTDKA